MSAQGTVTLRDVTGADLPVFFEFERDPVANEMAAFPARDREAFMQHWTVNILGNDTGRKRAILLDGEVVGNMLSWGAVGRHARRILDRARVLGRGVATRALTLFLTEVDTRPLHAHVVNHNIGSIRVLEKCGFRIVGEETVEEPGVRVVEVILRLEADPSARRAVSEFRTSFTAVARHRAHLRRRGARWGWRSWS